MSETRMAHGFCSEFSWEVTKSYCLGKLPLLNIWQKIQIVFDPRCKQNKTYLEAMPDAHLQTLILVMSDPRRFSSREIHALSTVNFPQNMRKKNLWTKQTWVY